MRKKHLLICFLIFTASHLSGFPEGMRVISGTADLLTVSEDKSWVIKSGARTILEWDQFSLSKDETLTFQQAGFQSAVLNRIVGSDSTQILGQLFSNGGVFVINPNGVLIGPDARVVASNFIASAFDVLNEEFLNSQNMRFSGENRSPVVNLGTIECKNGNIALLGRVVENKGVMKAEKGSVAMGASSEIYLKVDGSSFFISPTSVLDTPEGEESYLTNEGDIEALIVQLKSSGNPYTFAIQQKGLIDVSSYDEDGGFVEISSNDGISEVTGTILARSQEGKGGSVRVLGEKVGVLGKGYIDVSGGLGGGTILIGGDFQGKNPEIKNAECSCVSRGVQLLADAHYIGDGGQIIVWSDLSTRGYGKLSARGGAFGGDGGLLEVSGKKLDYQCLIDTNAPFGKMGTILLDPTDITISTGGDSGGSFDGGSPTNTYTPSGTSNVINTTTLDNNLASANVTITTSSAEAENGSITVSNAVSWSAATTLTLTADSIITISASITSSNAGGAFQAMTFTANGTNSGASSGILLSSGTVSAADGHISLDGTSTSGDGIQFSGGAVTTTSGDIDFTFSGGNRGLLLSNGGITSSTGDITFTGSGSTRGVSVTGNWSPTTTGTVTFDSVSSSSSASRTIEFNTTSVTTGGDLVFSNCSCTGLAGDLFFNFTALTVNGNFTASNLTGTTARLMRMFDRSITCTGSGSINWSGSITVGNIATIGVFQFDNGTIQTDTGSITMDASVTAGLGRVHGIWFASNADDCISSTSGDITLTGSTVVQNSTGVLFDSAQGSGTPITTGTITFQDCYGSGANAGVYFGSTYTSDGDIIFSTCEGGSTGIGVDINNTFTTSGSITATGVVGNGGAVGFDLAGGLSSTGTGGAISITASSTSSYGISISNVTVSTASADGGNLTLNGTGGSRGINITGASAAVTTGIGDISLTGSGSTYAVNIDSSATVNTTGAGDVTLIASSGSHGLGACTITSTSGNVLVTGAATLLASTPTITATAGNVTFSSTIDGAFALSAAAGGTMAFQGAVGATTPVTGFTTTATTGFSLSADITTTNTAISMSTPVTLLGAVTMTTGSAGITLGSTVNGAFALGLATTSDTVTLSGAVGGTTPLASLTTSGATITQSSTVTTTGAVGHTGSTAISLGGNVTTAGGTITMTGPVTLGTSIELDSTNAGGTAAGAAISCSTTVTGAQAFTVRAGTGGTIAFSGDLGTSGTPLTSLTLTSGLSLTLGAGVDIFLSNTPLTIPMAVTSSGDAIVDTGSL